MFSQQSPKSILGKMSAVSLVPESAVFFVLKTYFDKSNDEQKPTMTLACVAGTDSMWKEIDGGWVEILGRHDPPAAYWHTFEAVHFQGIYAREKGWDETKVAGLMNTLFSYLQVVGTREKYAQFTCTLDMNAYRKLHDEGYQMEAPPELLANACLDRIIQWYLFEYKGIDLESQLFFDTGEPFEPIIHAKWEQEIEDSKRTGIFGKWSHIKYVGTAPHWITPGIQVADLAAWANSRESNEFVDSYKHLALAMRSLLPSHWAKVDERQLRRRYRPLIYRP